MWQTEVICALSASGVAPLSGTPIYRASGDGDGDSDGGDGDSSRQADYAVCKNRSRGIPFVRRQKQPCVTAGVGDAGKEISHEGYPEAYSPHFSAHFRLIFLTVALLGNHSASKSSSFC